MHFLKKFLLWLVGILLLLVVLLYVFNVDYLLKAVRTIYLNGHTTAFLEDYKYFEPSAGEGAFSSCFKNITSIDIEPKFDGCIRGDFLSFTPDLRNKIVVGNLQLDIDKFETRVKNKVVDLTLREFEVLKYLANQLGQVVTRETLLEKVWGYEYYGDIRTVDVTVRRIREKIEEDTSNPKILITKRGVGYYIATGDK